MTVDALVRLVDEAARHAQIETFRSVAAALGSGGKPAGERMAGSVSAALYAVAQGARIVRVHDVAETVDALKVWQAAVTMGAADKVTIS